MGIEHQHITELETEIKELQKDLKQEKALTQALYKDVKVKNEQIEIIKKNFQLNVNNTKSK